MEDLSERILEALDTRVPLSARALCRVLFAGVADAHKYEGAVDAALLALWERGKVQSKETVAKIYRGRAAKPPGYVRVEEG